MVNVPNGASVETVAAAVSALKQHSADGKKKQDELRKDAKILHTALLMACTDLCGDMDEAVDLSRQYLEDGEDMLEFLESMPEEERGQILNLADARKRKKLPDPPND